MKIYTHHRSDRPLSRRWDRTVSLSSSFPAAVVQAVAAGRGRCNGTSAPAGTRLDSRLRASTASTGCYGAPPDRPPDYKPYTPARREDRGAL